MSRASLRLKQQQSLRVNQWPVNAAKQGQAIYADRFAQIVWGGNANPVHLNSLINNTSRIEYPRQEQPPAVARESVVINLAGVEIGQRVRRAAIQRLQPEVIK